MDRNLKQKLTRSAETGIEIFDKASKKEFKKFRETMKALKFKKLTKAEIINEIFEQDLERPARANAGNVLQDTYLCKLPNGYNVIILVGMIGCDFTKKGSSWVIVRNEQKQRVWVREFYRNISFTLLRRLAAYAHYAKNICAHRPGKMQLVQISENVYEWHSPQDPSTTKDFKEALYRVDLPGEYQKIVKDWEARHARYLKRTFGQVRREKDSRSTWKKVKKA